MPTAVEPATKLRRRTVSAPFVDCGQGKPVAELLRDARPHVLRYFIQPGGATRRPAASSFGPVEAVHPWQPLPGSHPNVEFYGHPPSEVTVRDEVTG